MLDATRLMNAAFWATAEETVALAEEIMALIDRFERRDDEKTRPAGARRVRVMTTIHSERPER